MHPNALQLLPEQITRHSVICFLEVDKTGVQRLPICLGLLDEGADDEGLISGAVIPAEARLAACAQLVLLGPFHKKLVSTKWVFVHYGSFVLLFCSRFLCWFQFGFVFVHVAPAGAP